MIRDATTADAAAISSIYNHYVTDTIITFEETPVSAQAMADRIRDTMAEFPWVVYAEGGHTLGYAYASRWKTRSAYRYSVESTVYVDAAQVGRGIGGRLYGRLLVLLGQRGLHAVVGGIALPNPASIALHEKFGFRKVAHFEQVGYKLGRWIDVGYWQKII
jgi:L-amino acid N-acyltransferase YncA